MFNVEYMYPTGFTPQIKIPIELYGKKAVLKRDFLTVYWIVLSNEVISLKINFLFTIKLKIIKGLTSIFSDNITTKLAHLTIPECNKVYLAVQYSCIQARKRLLNLKNRRNTFPFFTNIEKTTNKSQKS